MASFKDINKKFDATSIQQLYKKITDKVTNALVDKNTFPVTVVQSTFDGITGVRLDDILSHYNYIYLEFKGTRVKTRRAIPEAHRRNSLIISYKDFDNTTVLEQYIGESIKDVDWTNDENWYAPFTNGIFTVRVSDELTIDTILKYLAAEKIIERLAPDIIDRVTGDYIRGDEGNTIMVNLIKQYIAENIQLVDTIKEYLDENMSIETLFNQYLEQNLNIDDAVSKYINENINIEDFINNYLSENIDINSALNQYIENNLNIQDVINNYLEENLDIKQYIDNYLSENVDINNVINNNLQESIDNYFNTQEGSDTINNIVNEYLDQNLGDFISEESIKRYINEVIDAKLAEELKKYLDSEAGQTIINNIINEDLTNVVTQVLGDVTAYLQDNERVIANALARHEVAITDLQNK